MKKLLILFLTILSIFALIHGVWTLGYQKRYTDMAKHMEAVSLDGAEDEAENPEMRRYFKEVDQYRIGMKMPQYLGSGGYVSISKAEDIVVELDETGNRSGDVHLGMFLWPNYFSGFELGLSIYDSAMDAPEQIAMTSNLDLTSEAEEYLEPEEIERAKRLIAENREEIEKMIELAEKTLEIQIRES